jgi:exosortase
VSAEATDRNPLAERAQWAILFIAAAALLWQALPRLITEWNINRNMEHVILTLPAGLAFLVSRLRRLRESGETKQRADWTTALPCLALGMAVLFCEAVIEEEMLLAAGLVCGGMGTVAILGGRRAWARSLFPFLLIAFAIPLPESLARNTVHLLLQRASANCSGGLLALLGADARVTGTILYMGREALNVAEACSGLKALTGLCFVALVAGERFLPGRPGARAGLLLAGGLAAFLTNVLRLMAAAVIAGERGLEAAENFLHGWSVFFIYGIGTALLLGLAALWKDVRICRVAEGGGDV